ncbi:MAG: IS982 family transposase [Anaerolineae bacterium]|nr:IS982 family transposase [Anaerolineae bacterium]
MTSLLEVFCDVDDFCQQLRREQAALPKRSGQRQRRSGLCESEIMTILIHFHQSHYRDFKAYYRQYVCRHLTAEFPGLVSYSRYVTLLARVSYALTAYACSRQRPCSGISFVDSTPLRVCHNRRIQRHKVFAGLAARGQSSTGWYFGFKLHLVVNHLGELVAFRLTAGNVDDRRPLPILAKSLFGKLFGDKGYVSQPLFSQLWQDGVQLVTKLRTNMKNRLIPLIDRLLLRKRFIIETINDQLKNISQIEHSRHRSPRNFVLNLLAGLIAYTFQDKKPSLHFTSDELAALVACP